MSTASEFHAMVLRAGEDAATLQEVEMRLEELDEHAHFFWHDEIEAGNVLKCPDCGLTGPLQEKIEWLQREANTWRAEYEKLRAWMEYGS